MWFTDIQTLKVGAVSLTTPAQAYPVPETTPGGICLGPDGNLWFTGAPNGFGIASVGRMRPDGTYTLFPMPAGARLPEQIVAGPDGNLWYAEGFNHIGRVSTNGVFTIFDIPTATARPIGLTVGPDGAIWFAESAAQKIGRITVDGVVSEFSIPAPVGDPLFITSGPDGAIWFTQTYDNVIRRITTTGSFSTFTVPTPDGRPSRIITGPDGNLWFGEYAGTIGRLTPTGVFTEFSLPTSNPGITGLAVGADGAIWFNEANVAQIGRITTGACESGANTLCLNNRRFEVTAVWGVPSQGTSGHATAVSLTTDTGYFWFFTANNVELTVKVVDGRAFNNRFWVFGGALSDVQYTITVRDTVSGQIKTYANPQGTLASFADTDAF
jgi:virginiamycin B lyase